MTGQEQSDLPTWNLACQVIYELLKSRILIVGLGVVWVDLGVEWDSYVGVWANSVRLGDVQYCQLPPSRGLSVD